VPSGSGARKRTAGGSAAAGGERLRQQRAPARGAEAQRAWSGPAWVHGASGAGRASTQALERAEASDGGPEREQ
jgi:hypothetical protein